MKDISLLEFAHTRVVGLGLVCAPMAAWILVLQSKTSGGIAPAAVAGIWLAAFSGLVAVEVLREALVRRHGLSPQDRAAEPVLRTTRYVLRSAGLTAVYWGAILLPLCIVVFTVGDGLATLPVLWGLAILAALLPAMAVGQYIHARRLQVSKTRRAGGLTE